MSKRLPQDVYNKVMFRFDGYCAICCERKARSVHHVRPKKGNGCHLRNTPDLLVPLCGLGTSNNSCHQRVHVEDISEADVLYVQELNAISFFAYNGIGPYAEL